MNNLIISANPLFKEVISETAAQFQTEFIELSPEEAPLEISIKNPELIIVDDTINPTAIERILSAARRLEKSHLILLNPSNNEIILLESCRTTLTKVADLFVSDN